MWRYNKSKTKKKQWSETGSGSEYPMYFEPGVGGQGHVSLVRAAWSAFEEIPGTIIIPQYQINKTKQQHAVFWVLRGSLYAHYPLSPVINQKEGK